MDNFKEILEIEKKNNHKLNSIKKNLEKKKLKFIEDLNLKEEVIKNDYKKELDKDLDNFKKKLNKEAEKIVLEAKEEAKRIRKEANIDRALKLMLEGLKNV